MTIRELLRSTSAYPIPDNTIEAVALRRGLILSEDAERASESRDYRLAKADLLRWVANAPNVSQGGTSFTLSQDERAWLSAEADAIYSGPDSETDGPKWGYRGSRL